MSKVPLQLLVETMAEYRARDVDCITSHALADFRACPLVWKQKADGIIPPRTSAAFELGTAVHTFVLDGPDVFKSSYAIGGPVNPKTGKTYATDTLKFAEWAKEQGKPAIAESDAQMVRACGQAVLAHPRAMERLTGGQAEGVIRGMFHDVQCQARLDYWHPVYGVGELKTCEDLRWFEADARKWGYIYQVAWYAALFADLIEHADSLPPAYFVAVEKQPPYRAGVWDIDPGQLAQAAESNLDALAQLQECIFADVWPTGYEEPRLFDAGLEWHR